MVRIGCGGDIDVHVVYRKGEDTNQRILLLKWKITMSIYDG
jgi:hypothetical protein